MARRADHSREQLYELALATAADIVERDGYRALTARNVADAIGYSPGTLYNLFANLDDLIVHLNGRTLDELHDRLAARPATGDVAADLNRMLEIYLDFLKERPGAWNLLFEFALPDGIERPAWYQRKVDRALNLLEQVLAPAFEPGNGAGVKQAARVIWAGLHGICSLSVSGKLMVVSDQSMRDMAHALIDHYLAGIRALEPDAEGAHT
jgi:AcrR family transcriptional regulator